MDLISVIIPAYNGENFLADAIGSVVGQTYRAPIEIVVVDDGSTDGTADMVKAAQSSTGKDRTIIYRYQHHGGAAQARNTGLLLASGSIIGFLDADDLWQPDKLLSQIDVLKNVAPVQAVFGHVTEFVTGTGQGHRKPVQEAPAYLPGTMLARREVFDEVGLFDISLTVGEFVDWYSRATTRGLITKMLPDIVLRRRLHDNNMGLRHQASMTDYVSVLKAHLDRRRQGNVAVPAHPVDTCTIA